MRILTWILALASLSQSASPQPALWPVTRIDDVADVHHGVTVRDPYRWLEDQQSPETRTWITAQTAYARSVLDAVPGRPEIQRLVEGAVSVQQGFTPIATDGQRFLFSRGEGYYIGLPGDEKPQLVVRAPTGPDGQKVRLQSLGMSRDGRLFAYSVRKTGGEQTEPIFVDIDASRTLPDRLPAAVYSPFTFLPGGTGVIYVLRDPAGHRVRLHRFGDAPSADRTLFGEGFDGSWIIQATVSTDGRYMAAFANRGAGRAPSTRVFLADLANGGAFREVLQEAAGASFRGAFGGHILYLQTTWKAPNGRVLALDPAQPDGAPREVVSEHPRRVLQTMLLAGQSIVLQMLEEVRSQLHIVDPATRASRSVELPGLGQITAVTAHGWERADIFFSFTALANPVVHRYSVTTNARTVWSSPATSRDEDVEISQVWFPSRDGTRVPMFVMAKKGTARDGDRPTLLSAYGGFGAITVPFGTPEAVAWVRAGGVYAFANIRGGGELGDAWHKGGRLANKQNTFDDFIAAAEYLVREQYTRPARLAISGSSHAGMVVAVAALQRPELFRAVLSRVPHLDMIRYHRFPSAAPWVTEFGSPDVKDEFTYLYRYSPYHAVKDGTPYPAMMFVTGDADTRVAPLHARKMTARVQAATSSRRPVILRYDERSGHGGGPLPADRVAQIIDELGFLMSELGFVVTR